MLGEFTYALAIVSPVIMFSQLNLRAFMATDIKCQFEFSDYITTRLLSVFFALILIALIILVKNPEKEVAFLIVLVAIYKLIESISDLYYGVLQKYENMSYISISLILHGLLALASMALAIYFYRSILFGALIIAFSWLSLLLFYDIPATVRRSKFLFRLRWTNVPTVYKTCFPLGVIMGLITLRLSIPVYLIEAELGVDQVGYYSAVAYFLVAGNLVITSLIQATGPRLAHYYHQRESKRVTGFIIKLLLVSGSIGVFSIVLALYIGDFILMLLYGDGFIHLNTLLIWIIVAGSIGFLSQVMGLFLTVARLFKYQVISNLIGIISVAVLSYLFVPTYGVEGGAYALASGNGLIFLFNMISVLKNQKFAA